MPFNCNPAIPSRPTDSTTIATSISISVMPRCAARCEMFDGRLVMGFPSPIAEPLRAAGDGVAAVIDRLPLRIVLGDSNPTGGGDRYQARDTRGRAAALADLELSRRSRRAGCVTQKSTGRVKP